MATKTATREGVRLRVVQIRLTGTTPLVQHHQRMADPLDPAAKALKLITGKTRKTEEDHAEMARVEFMGSAYHDHQLGPYAPAEWVWRSVRTAAAQFRKGAPMERSLLVIPNRRLIPIEYDGPRELGGLFERPEHVLRLGVVNGGPGAGGRVMRTRPVFPEWSLTAEMGWVTSGVDLDDIARAAELAGWAYGIGDGRVIGYGRFTAEVTEGEELEALR